jgi:hypothetical protein
MKTNTARNGDHLFKNLFIHFDSAYQLWKRAVLYIAEYQLRKHQKPIPRGTAIIFFYKLMFVEKDFDCAYQLGIKKTSKTNTTRDSDHLFLQTYVCRKRF